MALLENKVAIVTDAGSRRGQGEAEARLLAENGATVVLVDIPVSDGAAIAAEIGADKAMFIPHDVTDAPGRESLVATVVKTYGHIDILVNNAGIWDQGGVLELAFRTSLDGYPGNYGRRDIHASAVFCWSASSSRWPLARFKRLGGVAGPAGPLGRR